MNFPPNINTAKTSRYQSYYDYPEPTYPYCGNCLSDNLKMGGNKYIILDIKGRCECLDCGWKGTKSECKIMTVPEWEYKYIQFIRRNKINKIKNK